MQGRGAAGCCTQHPTRPAQGGPQDAPWRGSRDRQDKGPGLSPAWRPALLPGAISERAGVLPFGPWPLPSRGVWPSPISDLALVRLPCGVHLGCWTSEHPRGLTRGSLGAWRAHQAGPWTGGQRPLGLHVPLRRSQEVAGQRAEGDWTSGACRGALSGSGGTERGEWAVKLHAIWARWSPAGFIRETNLQGPRGSRKGSSGGSYSWVGRPR